jgi:hypothetical protein
MIAENPSGAISEDECAETEVVAATGRVSWQVFLSIGARLLTEAKTDSRGDSFLEDL